MLPRHIFYFWGNEKMSWMRYLTLKSFRVQNPDWQITLYIAKCTRKVKPWGDDVEQDFFRYNGDDYLDKLKELNIKVEYWDLIGMPAISASHLSNFLKWHKLYSIGGIYADMDILWLQPIEELYSEMCKANTAICSTKYLSIGLLGSTVNNRMFGDIYDYACRVYTPLRYQSAGVETIYKLLYGSTIFNKDKTVDFNQLGTKDIISDIKDRWPDLIIYNIPFGIIYPFSCLEMEKVFVGNLTLPEHVIGLHWYAGHPISQKWNNLLTDVNVSEHANTFARYARRYVD